MKISNSKKQLAKIIHENGGWRDGEFAAQDGDGGVGGYGSKPEWNSLSKYWWREAFGGWFLANKIKNHHQTVLSREEYFHLHPAPDAEAEQKAEIRWVRGKDIYATPTAHDCMEMLKEKLGSTECGCDECSAFYSKPAAHAESTIEQLAAEYRIAKDCADRKQQEADAAKADADAKLAELVAAGKALGLVLSVAEPEPELVITDWRDLLPGDEVEYVEGGQEWSIGMVGVVHRIDHDGNMNVRLLFGDKGAGWPTKWRFIRRPVKGGADA